MHTDDWKLDDTIAITLQWYLLVSLEMFLSDEANEKSLTYWTCPEKIWPSWALIVSFCHIQRKQIEFAE